MKQFLSICVLAALVVGCFEERITWSPDGNHALVRGDDVYLTDPSGHLSPLGVGGTSCIAWMPDGKRFVAAAPVELKTWDQAKAKFPADAAIASANSDAVRAELLAWHGKWEDFAAATTQKLKLSLAQLALAMMDLREHDAATLQPDLGKDIWQRFSQEDFTYARARLFAIDGDKATPGPILYESALDGSITVMRPSPTGAAVALSINVAIPMNSPPSQLLAVAADGSRKTCDLGVATDQPDWTPDGKYLVYVRPADGHADANDKLPLGILTRRPVFDDKGTLLSTDQLPREEDLAGLLYSNETRVRVAPDGRIFFATLEINLPTTPQDVSTQSTIFYLDPGKSATLTRVIPRGTAPTIGDSAQYFELSPDARYVSIPFGDGRVSVLDIATGEAKIVQESTTGNSNQIQMVPQWRTATELTFLRPPSQGGIGAMVLYSMTDNSSTVMSAGWENSPLKELVAPKPATQPTSSLEPTTQPNGPDHVGQ